jgi:hypothetical protein
VGDLGSLSGQPREAAEERRIVRRGGETAGLTFALEESAGRQQVQEGVEMRGAGGLGAEEGAQGSTRKAFARLPLGRALAEGLEEAEASVVREAIKEGDEGRWGRRVGA